jgi:cell division protein FtsI/penicillin-binding protein 2
MLLRPRIVHAIDDANGNPIYTYGPEVEQRVIAPETAATLRAFLRAVVVRGTGTPAAIPGYTVAGKTGTAQVVANGVYESGAYIASFIGMIPAEHPRYVILVKVDQPHGSIYGGVVAAPVFAALAREAMLHAGVMPAVPPPPRLGARHRTAKGTP